MSKKILVVDDDELVLIALEELLKPCGYEVSTALNGQAALEKVGEEKFDLMMVDIIMPGIDGFELCRKIREIELYRTVPIIILTAKSSKEDTQKGIDAGANLFLPKPISPQRLLDLVKNSLE
jgi:CheY-like chemotaxis protein